MPDTPARRRGPALEGEALRDHMAALGRRPRHYKTDRVCPVCGAPVGGRAVYDKPSCKWQAEKARKASSS